jgi:lycopene cyclase domain-containing protein
MSNFLYAAILLFSVFIPAIFTFEPNFKFHKKAPKLLIAILVGAILFIAWDIKFTEMGVWGFNSTYYLGLKFFDLPIEEILFFFIIPYSCIFLHEAFYYHFDIDPLKKVSKFISGFLIIFCSAIALINIDKAYTLTAMSALTLVLMAAEFVFKNKEMSRFYLVFLIVIVFFAIDNGILTGSFIPGEVVWYNDEENLGFRFGTIPFEDIFYGMSLILLDFLIYKKLVKRSKKVCSPLD